jgi:hypothetical protein
VVNYSSRGFGRSCGVPDSRTAGCERGWTHLFDQRYEARDTQHLLGLLVDQGIAKVGALGVTGVSGGSLQSLQLAFLRNRVRLPNGRFAVWRSPAGRRLSITAAFPTWTGHDIAAALQPNGRFLDFERPRVESLAPIGVASQAFINALLLVAQSSGFIAPRGADPTADLLSWKDVVDRGEPYGGPARGIVNQLTAFHSSVRLRGAPAPVLVQNGWADDLFPASEALRLYNALRVDNPRARVSLQLIDTGHARGGAHLDQERAANDQAVRFFDAWLRRRGTPPRAGAVLAYTQVCPRDAPGGRRITARSWAEIHPGAKRFSSTQRQTVTSQGGDPELARAFTPNFGTSDACKTAPAAAPAAGTAVVQRSTGTGFTLVGRPTVTLRVAGGARSGQIASRLWDVDPATGTQVLVTRGVYRLAGDPRGNERVFQLNGNAYRFAPGHRVKLELLGRDPDTYRESDFNFAFTATRIALELPVSERPSRARGIVRPRFAVDPAVAR